MSFSVQIGNTRLSNEVNNLAVTNSSSTGATGPAGSTGATGARGETGPTGAVNFVSITFAPGFSGTGAVYSAGTMCYWELSVIFSSSYSSGSPIISSVSDQRILPSTTQTRPAVYSYPNTREAHATILSCSSSVPLSASTLGSSKNGGLLNVFFSYNL